MNKVYEMELHDTTHPAGDFKIIRVPGGWIYRFYEINQVTMADGTWSENYFCDSVFVPFDNEFMEKRHE